MNGVANSPSKNLSLGLMFTIKYLCQLPICDFLIWKNVWYSSLMIIFSEHLNINMQQINQHSKNGTSNTIWKIIKCYDRDVKLPILSIKNLYFNGRV